MDDDDAPEQKRRLRLGLERGKAAPRHSFVLSLLGTKLSGRLIRRSRLGRTIRGGNPQRKLGGSLATSRPWMKNAAPALGASCCQDRKLDPGCLEVRFAPILTV